MLGHKGEQIFSICLIVVSRCFSSTICISSPSMRHLNYYNHGEIRSPLETGIPQELHCPACALYLETTRYSLLMTEAKQGFFLLSHSNLGMYFSLISSSALTILDRPAAVSLPHLPTAAVSSPDGGCLILAFCPISERPFFRAYHWSTFGSTQGITLDLPTVHNHPWMVTSVVRRDVVHFIWLDKDAQHCVSVALDIKTKTTEFMFQETGQKANGKKNCQTSQHNSLIDCHADVWTRYPVFPAICRQVISSARRYPQTRVFVSNKDHSKFGPYFNRLIKDFTQKVHKPTGGELGRITVEACTFPIFFSGLANSYRSDWEVSQFQAGEWLVDLLCLIPIHIAITRDNRFLPLKDGVTSNEFEQLLLGAEVGRIVDALSFGWYESIFQSYQAEKVCFLSLLCSDN